MELDKKCAGLSDKDLHCIARHIQTLVKLYWHKESMPQKDCQLCAYSNNCGVDPWDSFIKLSEITGVRISPHKGFMA
jgi:hypothetical protein